jgi:uncharacterized protein (TIGR02646 family)
MRKFERLPEPAVLRDNWEQWGEQYKQRREQNPTYRFNWPVVSGVHLNQLLKDDLLAQTQQHCSYCDKYPLDERGDHTIDHFRPKSTPVFYKEVCYWPNLYISCNGCQNAKLTTYRSELLRPDEMDYSFERYFSYNYSEDKIDARTDLSTEDYERAYWTIKIFDLNATSLRKARAIARRRYAKDTEPHIDDYNFRYIFD